MKKMICMSLGIILLNVTVVEGMNVAREQSSSDSNVPVSILKRPSKRMRLEAKHVDFKIPEKKRAISNIDEFFMDNGKFKQGEMLTVMRFLEQNNYKEELKVCRDLFEEVKVSEDDKLFIRIFLNAHFSDYQQFRTDLLGNVDRFLSSSEKNTRTQFMYFLENRIPLIKNKFGKQAAEQVLASLRSTGLSEDGKLELAVMAWNFWDDFLDELERQPVVDEKQLWRTRIWRWYDYINPISWAKWYIN